MAFLLYLLACCFLTSVGNTINSHRYHAQTAPVTPGKPATEPPGRIAGPSLFYGGIAAFVFLLTDWWFRIGILPGL